jgi:hypothetical protein
MARIIENETGKRRIIKMTSDDVLNVVREYQKYVRFKNSAEEIRNQLEDCVIFIPEDM